MRLNKPYHYLSILVSSLIICQSVLATPQIERVNLTQQPPNETPDSNRIAAEKTEEEAQKLLKEKAPLTQIIAKWEEALKYWHLAKDSQKEAKTLWMIAAIYHLRGEHPKVLEYAQKSSSIYESLGDRKGIASALTFISMSYQNLGEYQKAIDSFKQLISLSEHPEVIAGVLANMAQSYAFLGETQKTLDTYNQIVAFWQEKGDFIKQAEALDRIAAIYIFLGENQKSLEFFKQANALDPDYKRDSSFVNSNYQLLVNSSCVDKLVSLKKPPQLQQSENSGNQSATVDSPAASNNNIENFQQNAQEYRRQESLDGEAGFLELLAGLEYNRIGEYKKALQVYQEALEIRQLMGDKLNETETLASIADILNLQGKKQEAINALNQALEIQRQIKIRPKEAESLLTLGDVYQSLGAYSQSLEVYQQALSLFRVIGDRSNETDTMTKIGAIYQKLQDYPQALNYYQQALSLSRTTGNCHRKAFSLDYISQVYLALGDYQKAMSIGNEALTLSSNLGAIEIKLALESRILHILAKVEIKKLNYRKALELAEKSRKSGQESSFRTLEANAIAVNAEAYEALKQPEKAMQTYQEQSSLYAQMGLQSEQAQTLYNIAKLERKQGNLSASLNSINEAINIIENIRKEVASPELRTSFFATKQDYYELKINILMEMHQKDPSKDYDAQAFNTSERSRARTLLELLNEANADIRQGVDPNLLEQENTLKDKLAALDQRWSEIINKNPTEEQKNNLEQERKTLLSKSQQIQAQIRAKSPKYAALTQPQPLTLTQVQKQILDPDTVLLQYSLGAEKSYLWLITKDSLNTYILSPKKDIETSAKELLDAIKYDKDRTDIITEAASQLSQVILAPTGDKLTKKRLLIVADGVLNYIPFSTLSLSNTPLITQYEIVNLPSSSSISIIRQETLNRKPAPKALAILADPIFSTDDDRVNNSKPTPVNQNDLNFMALKRSVRAIGDNNNLPRLPGTRQEAKAILTLIPDPEETSAFDDQANLDFANNPQLSQYRIVHFATHGIFNGEAPELSGVVLSLVNEKGNSLNGFLRLADIFNLNLPAELVVLSACETGLGKEVKGEGLVGLTRGFMYAGSPRVLVSLWQVDDEATAQLMTKFYKLMLEKKLPPAEALRQAQLEIQKQPQWQSPYYWAAFVIQGEWR